MHVHICQVHHQISILANMVSLHLSCIVLSHIGHVEELGRVLVIVCCEIGALYGCLGAARIRGLVQ